MKKLIAYITVFLCFGFGYAQKMAYVDTQKILKEMPQYQQADQRLNTEVKKWQTDILDQQSKLDKLKIAFENEKVLLTDEQQKSKLAVIDSTERKLNNFIDKKFGTKGESVGLRYNLMKPLQDQIWNAINTVAAKDKYNVVFDISSDLIMIYTDSRYDITEKILKQLGVKSEEQTNKSKSSSKDKQPNKSSSKPAATTKKPIQKSKEVEDKNISETKDAEEVTAPKEEQTDKEAAAKKATEEAAAKKAALEEAAARRAAYEKEAAKKAALKEASDRRAAYEKEAAAKKAAAKKAAEEEAKNK